MGSSVERWWKGGAEVGGGEGAAVEGEGARDDPALMRGCAGAEGAGAGERGRSDAGRREDVGQVADDAGLGRAGDRRVREPDRRYPWTH